MDLVIFFYILRFGLISQQRVCMIQRFYVCFSLDVIFSPFLFILFLRGFPVLVVADNDDGRNDTFVIGDDHFPASLLDLPGIVESYKTYDDNVLIKTADVGQIIMVRDEGDPAPDVVEYRHGLTPPMRDARRRRFRREPDLNVWFLLVINCFWLNIIL
ncbi:putative TAFII55 protein region [Helianthus anomalus]